MLHPGATLAFISRLQPADGYLLDPAVPIAAAARETDRIKLCPGAHLLPYHDPATLATRCAWLTRVTGSSGHSRRPW